MDHSWQERSRLCGQVVQSIFNLTPQIYLWVTHSNIVGNCGVKMLHWSSSSMLLLHASFVLFSVERATESEEEGKLTLLYFTSNYSVLMPFVVIISSSSVRAKVWFPRWGNCSALRALQFIPAPPSPVHFVSPCFNSGLSNYHWSTECMKHDFVMSFFFRLCCKSNQHCEIYDH